jgi:hypothetical protein
MRARAIAILVVIGLAGLAGLAGGDASGRSPSQPAAGSGVREVTTWYFYKVKWGHQDEFLDLFQRNHYPVLKARMQAGGYATIRTYVPRYHGDGRADWTFAVELVAREGATGVPSEEEVVRKLYPDSAKFRREEQRRFEILDAHWDVPLTVVDLDSRVPASR